MIAKVRNQTLDSFAGLGVVTHDTMAEYEALSQEEKMDGNVHLVLEEEPINANIVEYTDGKTVKDELDDIAEKTGNTDISAIGDGTTTGAIGSLNTHFTDIGKRCSTPIQAPTSIGGSVNVTVTDTAHNVWIIKCGLRSGWAIWLLAIGSIRWLTTQTSDGSIEVQGTANNTLAVRYINTAGASGDTVEVYAIK